jgi:hypothetical protein
VEGEFCLEISFEHFWHVKASGGQKLNDIAQEYGKEKEHRNKPW